MTKHTQRILIPFTEGEIDDLSGLIDGCLGTSESADFNRVFKRILKRLDKAKSGRKVNKSIPKIEQPCKPTN